MYPTASRLPEKLQADIEFLVKTVEDPQHKPYLKAPLLESLTSLGHEPKAARAALDDYFKVTLQ